MAFRALDEHCPDARFDRRAHDDLRGADTSAHADEQHHGHEGVAGEVGKMTDPARLAADAGKFAELMTRKYTRGS